MVQPATQSRELKIGDFAPDFTLDTDTGKNITLSGLRGKNVVLYFYPKDDTPGCTLEAKAFTDALPEFKKRNAEIIGVSRDDVKSHEAFKQKYCLGFPLASDEFGTVCEAYGTWVEKSMYGKKYMGIQRDTFLIDASGKIAQIWRKVRVEDHAKEVLDAVKNLG